MDELEKYPLGTYTCTDKYHLNATIADSPIPLFKMYMNTWKEKLIFETKVTVYESRIHTLFKERTCTGDWTNDYFNISQ